MPRYTSDSVADAALDYIIDNSDTYVLCDGMPADYAAATTDNGSGGVALGETAIDASDFTKSDGDTDGRKLTCAGQEGIDIDADGNADHVALLDTAGSELILATEISNPQPVTAGNTAETDPFDHEVGDPQAG